jgi:AmiR/NasT family two-component response regulator
MTAPWSDAASLIEDAKGIVMARRGCTSEEASSLLSAAAQEHEMSVSDLAECVVADQDLRLAAPQIPN